MSNIGCVLFAGVIFNLANLLLVAGIDMVGLATAFPVAIGIALVVGTILSYILQPKGNVMMIGAGLVCALVAVIMDGKAYGQFSTGKVTSRKSIITCVVSGMLMGLGRPSPPARSLTEIRWALTASPCSSPAALCFPASSGIFTS